MKRVIKKIILILILVFLTFFPSLPKAEAQNRSELLFFFSQSCHRCHEVKDRLIPNLLERYKDKINIDYRDIGKIENYKFLLSLEEKYSFQNKEGLPVLFINGYFLDGKDISPSSLESFLINSLNNPKPDFSSRHKQINLLERFKNFSPMLIISAGLIDGINPCAFTVIVFFISFLFLQGYKTKELLAVGLSFILAVFATYILIGLGIFGFLYSIEGFWRISGAISFLIGIFAIILGILSIHDIFKFLRTHDTEAMFLQLPRPIKEQIHRIVTGHTRRKTLAEKSASSKGLFLTLIISAMLTGFLVSLLEAVCTGQTYLPTISFILRATQFKIQALGYLILYNFMFIVPLAIIFILALSGVRSEAFAAFLRRHLIAVKILMAGLFFVLGIILIWRF